MWKCKENCNADCCGSIYMDRELVEKNKHKMQRKFKEIKIFDNISFVETEDGKCVFLGWDNNCAIYDQRPQICRDYGQTPELPCPYVDLRGKLRTPAKVRRTQRQIDKNVDRQIAHLEKIVKEL